MDSRGRYILGRSSLDGNATIDLFEWLAAIELVVELAANCLLQFGLVELGQVDEVEIITGDADSPLPAGVVGHPETADMRLETDVQTDQLPVELGAGHERKKERVVIAMGAADPRQRLTLHAQSGVAHRLNKSKGVASPPSRQELEAQVGVLTLDQTRLTAQAIHIPSREEPDGAEDILHAEQVGLDVTGQDQTAGQVANTAIAHLVSTAAEDVAQHIAGLHRKESTLLTSLLLSLQLETLVELPKREAGQHQKVDQRVQDLTRMNRLEVTAVILGQLEIREQIPHRPFQIHYRRKLVERRAIDRVYETEELCLFVSQ